MILRAVPGPGPVRGWRLSRTSLVRVSYEGGPCLPRKRPISWVFTNPGPALRLASIIQPAAQLCHFGSQPRQNAGLGLQRPLRLCVSGVGLVSPWSHAGKVPMGAGPHGNLTSPPPYPRQHNAILPRRRRETTLSTKAIAGRMHLGSSKAESGSQTGLVRHAIITQRGLAVPNAAIQSTPHIGDGAGVEIQGMVLLRTFLAFQASDRNGCARLWVSGWGRTKDGG